MPTGTTFKDAVASCPPHSIFTSPVSPISALDMVNDLLHLSEVTVHLVFDIGVPFSIHVEEYFSFVTSQLKVTSSPLQHLMSFGVDMNPG